MYKIFLYVMLFFLGIPAYPLTFTNNFFSEIAKIPIELEKEHCMPQLLYYEHKIKKTKLQKTITIKNKDREQAQINGIYSYSADYSPILVDAQNKDFQEVNRLARSSIFLFGIFGDYLGVMASAFIFTKNINDDISKRGRIPSSYTSTVADVSLGARYMFWTQLFFIGAGIGGGIYTAIQNTRIRELHIDRSFLYAETGFNIIKTERSRLTLTLMVRLGQKHGDYPLVIKGRADTWNESAYARWQYLF